MTSKQRFISALERRTPDRLPATTHTLMSYFLKHYMNGMAEQDFFDHFGLDPIIYLCSYAPETGKDWEIVSEATPDPDYPTVRHVIRTPKGTLTAKTQSNEITTWLIEPLVKEKRDIDCVAFAPAPRLDVATVNRAAEAYGERGLVRGGVPGFDIFGQPGCWQDAACLYGIQNLILTAMEDPAWVHELLTLLLRRKLTSLASYRGAQYDLVELGGGDASSSVISPEIFDAFVAPYDSQIIALAHELGLRVVYHTCGGMMPFLERIADMGPDAMETFTPPGMGGDVDLAEAKRRIGDRVCFIGGFDQHHFLRDCAPEDTRAEVRRCFEAAGKNGGFILSMSDHFFDADPELIRAYADEARACVY
ncbi:MAG TPA: uroporphyrinogen decarboxylase family protein [Candidatus Hydrogenedentes bacterium]|nr:uroporphyrinogen decarboxylase family protein [Candidatus Hydrogenedentota bacterium]HOS03862.1 uroporphyrinogen decarboxylase family protein [Candidatus Hydrogenedentota bacterium]